MKRAKRALFLFPVNFELFSEVLPPASLKFSQRTDDKKNFFGHFSLLPSKQINTRDFRKNKG